MRVELITANPITGEILSSKIVEELFTISIENLKIMAYKRNKHLEYKYNQRLETVINKIEL